MFQPNAVIAGRYQVVRLVGQGGMSNLYLAFDRKYSNATVVVKEMTASYSDPKEQKMAVDLFHREAKLLASLNHRHIPKVYDYFQFAGKYYLSMEYIDGDDLAVKLEEKKGPLPEDQVLEWGEQIAQVLFYLHKHEPPIVFRDVKPSNIMISSKGVKLIDFGIARHFDQAKKGDTMRIGSPGYAPPEQYAAQTDPRSDIYALGVTLHHALTGRDPTATNTPFLVPPARDINPALQESTAAMLARATQLDPADRYQSALDMRKDIKHILKRGKQSTRVVGAPPALPADAQQTASKTTNIAPAPGGGPQTPAANSASAAAPQPAGAGGPQAAASAGSPQSSNSGSSGNLPSQQSAGGSGSLAGTGTQASGSPPPDKKRKRPSLATMLLVAMVFALSAGVAALVAMPTNDREALFTRVKHSLQEAVPSFYQSDSPETRIRDSLLNGTPEALLTVFQSADFQDLSEEKKELYRLNLLALGSEQGPVRYLHVLVPDSFEDGPLWRVASKVVGTVNSTGGLGRELLVIIPETYQAGALAPTLSRLSKVEKNGANRAFLVVDGSQEKLPEDFAEPLHRLSAAEVEGPHSISSEPTFEQSFQLTGLLAGDPYVWALPGNVPSTATAPEQPLSTPLAGETLKALLRQSQDMGGKLLLRAEDGGGLSGLEGKGSLLLLATSAQQLPAIGSNQTAEALVLSSPFEPSKLSHGAIHLRPAEIDLSLQEARAFDALLLSALPLDKSFQGLTMIRQDDGSYSDKHLTRYSWTGKTWLPSLGESGKNE